MLEKTNGIVEKSVKFILIILFIFINVKLVIMYLM